MRAAGADLTIAISPLGLIELSDEEFEVHGPRMIRYAHNMALYLGHHWGYRRVAGEPQITFNYSRCFSDWLTTFTFGKGVQFSCDQEFQHIIPALLDRVWTRDNEKKKTLWEMGQMGSVCGDCFVKVAYDPAYQDSSGMAHPGKVRILPINPSFAFPEWHPHDRDRLIRFKLKYRFWTTSAEGTRQVMTYVEILTDDVIEEYINDELIDRRPNPLGVIPIVHIANLPTPSSPWGLADIQDVNPLNLEYNEKATEISDIVNYYTAPVTVITGAKAGNLERGPNKIWSINQKDARIENLEGGQEGIAAALEYLSTIKRAMHEMAGVPETAFGQDQEISNTSGVALAIQYMPAMQKYAVKIMQYEEGIKKINRLALKTLFLFEPDSVLYNPNTSGIMLQGQPPVIDPADPAVYDIDLIWPPPLPVDNLILLNEIMVKMQLGLESKKGALRDLNEQFPDEKLQELFEEKVVDAKQDGAMDILKHHIAAAIIQLTGTIPDGVEMVPPPPAPPASGSSSSSGGGRGGNNNPQGSNQLPSTSLPTLPGLSDISGITNDAGKQMMADLVTQAYGTKLPQRRDADADNG